MAGIDSYAVLNLHGDGDDQSTTIPDSGGGANCPHTVTCVGNAQIDTAQKEFGTGSILFDGTGDYLSLADSDDWNFGAGDFTIDWWQRRADVTLDETIVAQFATAGQRAWDIELRNQYGYLWVDFKWTTDGTTVKSSGNVWDYAFVNDTWYHIAIVRNGANLNLYINGNVDAATVDMSTDTIAGSTDLLCIGSRQGIIDFNGWIDELRISKGIARWTANFTPPTAEYDTSLDDSFTATALGLTSLLGTHTPVWGSSFTASALTLALTQHIAVQVIIVEDSLVLTLHNPTVTISSSVTTTVQELTSALKDPTYKWDSSVTLTALELTTALKGGVPFLVTAILRRTYSFGATELVTSDKLHNLIESCIWDVSNQTAGDMFYFNGTKWMRVAKGTDGKVMKMVSGVPAWA